MHAMVLAAAVFLRDLPQAKLPAYRIELRLLDSNPVTASPPSQQTVPSEHPSSSSPPHTRSADPSTAQHPLAAGLAGQDTAPHTAHMLPSDVPPATMDNPIPLPQQAQPAEPKEEFRSDSEPAQTTIAESVINSHHDETPVAPQYPTNLSESAMPSIEASSHSAHLASDSLASSLPDTAIRNHPANTRSISATAHYRWLADLLKQRILSLQAYPRLARMQGWEGIVLLRATIKDDGSLLHAAIVKSSGYAALDEDALALIRRACPMHLPHNLDQPALEISIPVHYRLER